jgi:hypothetical protein
MPSATYLKLLDMEADLVAIKNALAGGGTSGTQYTDGAAAPTHPVGNQIMFNNGGTETAVSAANPFPTSATVTPAANQRVNSQSGDFVAGSIVDLAALSAIVSGGKGAVKAGAGDFADLATLAGIVSANKAAVKAAANDIADLATLATIVSGAKAAIKSATNDIVDLATLLARHTDTFGNNTAISAATTFGAIPLTSALAANSYATLPNASYMATFSAQINVASAFVGTIGFYGLLPDGATLQQINAHQRGTASNGNQSAINTGSALEQTWEGSIAGFKAIYVVCSAFTSGAASVQIGLTAANYAHAILNTVASNLTQLNGTAPQLDGGSSNRLGTSLYGKNSTAGDTAIKVNSGGDQYILGDFTEQASLSAGSLNADLVPSTDVSNYKWLSLHINANAYSGTLTFQCSNDNVNWIGITLYKLDTASANNAGTATSLTNVMFAGPTSYRYFRVRMTSYTSGTGQGTLELYTVAPAYQLTAISALQSGGWSLGAATSGGTSDFHRISTADTNAVNIKASAGQIYGYDIGNNGASDAYVKLYNKASSPTVGTDTPFRTIYVPKGTAKTFHSTTGLAMGTGISLAITGGAADADSTAVGAAQVTVEIDYK